MLQDRGKRRKIFFRMEQPGDGAGMEKMTEALQSTVVESTKSDEKNV